MNNKWKNINSSMHTSLGRSLRVAMGDFLWNSVSNSVEYPIGAYVMVSIWDSIANSIGTPIKDSMFRIDL